MNGPCEVEGGTSGVLELTAVVEEKAPRYGWIRRILCTGPVANGLYVTEWTRTRFTDTLNIKQMPHFTASAVETDGNAGRITTGIRIQGGWQAPACHATDIQACRPGFLVSPGIGAVDVSIRRLADIQIRIVVSLVIRTTRSCWQYTDQGGIGC